MWTLTPALIVDAAAVTERLGIREESVKRLFSEFAIPRGRSVTMSIAFVVPPAHASEPLPTGAWQLELYAKYVGLDAPVLERTHRKTLRADTLETFADTGLPTPIGLWEIKTF